MTATRRQRRLPLPLRRDRRLLAYWAPLWHCLACGALLHRFDVRQHVLDHPGHGCVPAL